MKVISSIPDYKVYEYMLVLYPHEELQNKITCARKEFADSYKTTAGLYDKPAITLCMFLQYELSEERIIQHLKLIATSARPVKIELKDFGSFPSHTIYINVTSKMPILGLVKEIRTETQKLMKFDAYNKPHFILEPHITVARKLQPWQYEKGWLEYSHHQFTGRFIAHAMLLLKRPVNEMKYQIAGRFEFQNLPVTAKQGALFS